MNAVGLLTADKVKTRAASAAKTAFEAWQVGTRLSSVCGKSTFSSHNQLCWACEAITSVSVR